MKSFTFALLASLVLSSNLVLASGTLVIVDIDDTLKESHVASTSAALLNAFRTDIPFWQMSSLLNALKANGARIAYVSTAPRTPMESYHRAFLDQNNFPVGDVFLPTIGNRKNYKLRTIREILSLDQPDTLIFFGDNGQEDPAIYGTIEAENPSTKVMTFIRWVYKDWTTGPFVHQIPFVTVGEVSLDLFDANFLTNQQAHVLLAVSLVTTVPPPDEDGNIVRRRGLNLPDWVDCTGFHLSLFPKADFMFEHDLLKSEVERRCD